MRIALFGATGRVGQEIVRAAVKQNLDLTAAISRPEGPWLGRDIGELAGVGRLGVEITGALDLAGAEVLIDFSSPAGTARALSACALKKVPLVVGTTGLPPQLSEEIDRAARHIAVVQSANMSVGINVLKRVTELVAAALGEGFDIEIVEAHHRRKKDAPSGTALLLAESAAKGRGLAYPGALKSGRDGLVGERPQAEIGLHAVRGGAVIGEHTVHFLGDEERVELTHRAESRAVFAAGALRAARWVIGQKPGRYDMGHVLGLPLGS